jgi:hypothetical protein
MPIKNDNATRPAFPGYTLRENPSGAKIYDSHIGLTKREYFAGLALQGLLSQNEIPGSVEQICIWAANYADTLLHHLAETTVIT